MNFRRIIFAALPIFLICVVFIPNVHAQSTNISSLNFPAQVAFQNGGDEATVTFTVTYNGLPQGGILRIAVWNPNPDNTCCKADDFGSGTTSPDQCSVVTAGAALCDLSPSSSSGTESASFTIQIWDPNAPPTTFPISFLYYAFASMFDQSHNYINNTQDTYWFTINVVQPSSFSFLTQPYVLGGVIVVVAVVALSLGYFVGKRRKGENLPPPP